MKPEEAIKRIKNLIKGREDPRGKTELDFALDMAIEALKETERNPTVTSWYDFDRGYNVAKEKFERPHGEWSGEPERKKMVTRVCIACGERGAVGHFCMWCGADMWL